MSEEYIEVGCPFCSEIHTYELKVERPDVVRYISSFSSWLSDLKKVTFKRIFTCPRSNNKFEAEFEMIIEEGAKVDVSGLVKRNKDERE